MIEAILGGAESVAYRGEAWTGPNAEGDLCRCLIGRGVDPAERVVFLRDGKPALSGSLAAFARRRYPGGDAHGHRWTPHPLGEYPPLLLAWYDARKAPFNKRPR
jgi:hypothetical protein